MMRQNVEHHQPILFTAAHGYLVAEYNFLTVIVNARTEDEGAGFRAQHVTHRAIHHPLRRSTGSARGNNGPTREATCDFLHVLLCIAAVDAKRVQLHQFTRVVFIDAASLLLLLLRSLLLLIVTHS